MLFFLVWENCYLLFFFPKGKIPKNNRVLKDSYFQTSFRIFEPDLRSREKSVCKNTALAPLSSCTFTIGHSRIVMYLLKLWLSKLEITRKMTLFKSIMKTKYAIDRKMSQENISPSNHINGLEIAWVHLRVSSWCSAIDCATKAADRTWACSASWIWPFGWSLPRLSILDPVRAQLSIREWSEITTIYCKIHYKLQNTLKNEVWKVVVQLTHLSFRR